MCPVITTSLPIAVIKTLWTRVLQVPRILDDRCSHSSRVTWK